MQPTMLEGQAPMQPQAPMVISKASLPPSASLPNMPTTGGKKKGKGGGGGGAGRAVAARRPGAGQGDAGPGGEARRSLAHGHPAALHQPRQHDEQAPESLLGRTHATTCGHRRILRLRGRGTP